MKLRFALCASIMLFLANPAVLGAWTQLRNAYPEAPTSCNGTSHPCVEWPVGSGGSSVTRYVYLSSTLGDANLNLATDMRNGMSSFNSQPARNPFYLEYTSGSWQIYAQRAYPSRLDAWAETIVYANSSNVITSATIKFNPLVWWNRNYNYGTYDADARKVAAHEIGHSQALGHTGFYCLMTQGAIGVSTPQTNDRQGLQAIYGAA